MIKRIKPGERWGLKSKHIEWFDCREALNSYTEQEQSVVATFNHPICRQGLISAPVFVPTLGYVVFYKRVYGAKEIEVWSLSDQNHKQLQGWFLLGKTKI